MPLWASGKKGILMAGLIVFCTASSIEEADKLAEALVQKKLAACVSRVPQIYSTYWWKGKMERAEESLLIIKTDSKKFDALSKQVKALHSYTVPEILALPIVKGNPDYLAWMRDSLRSK
jgi:periplasmic divalent cation tolerance protein